MTVVNQAQFSTGGTDVDRRLQIGVDIGGTFTDVVLEAPQSSRVSTKVLTTHTAPELGVFAGIQSVLSQAGAEPQQVGLIVHGTTLATNALIERRGARTALLTTAGFRDVVETRSEERFEQYDLTIDLPQPLVPRKWRFGIEERVDVEGNVLKSLATDDVMRLVETLRRQEIESIAIGFLHSYRFPDHERRVRDILRASLPDLWVTMSSDVSPEMREYERFSTACANAYVQPLIASYLERLQAKLRADGMTAPLRLMLSGGGLTTVETAQRYPVRLVESGPAGGALFAASIAKQCELDRVLSFDMGGTTAKICLIDDQKPLMSRSFEVARVYRFKKGSGLPLRIPVIEMVEIGAGGGSIAGVDRLGRVTVGPESAGSEPGPACYGRGGSHPTVTDADLALGRLDAQAFAGGSFILNRDASADVLHRDIAAKQGLDVEMAAWTISEVVEENMASAARVHAIESGVALSDRTMIAFGGAAPLHALRMAEKVGINRVIIPSGAGVGSAVGFLKAPLSFEIARSQHSPLSQLDIAETKAMLNEITSDAWKVVAETAGHDRLTTSLTAFMRYAGQGHEISVPVHAFVDKADDVATLRESFEAEYLRVYSRAVPAADVELLSWAVTVSADREASAPDPSECRLRRPSPLRIDKLFDPDRGGWTEVQIYHRDSLAAGDIIDGPAVIQERETSTLITAAFRARINEWDCIDCTRKSQ
ncbi:MULTISPECIES: hydantoinase/oxoprolinase family protein [unclassified Beijerinckia]|uniref:hydantoinase/oxoprolinase family protein n=1 Tax=unclassified Beijerinckia TaxID=2638183 RepID=UPI00089471F0|nr:MULTISPECIES: hydantoinase/oxoprolinase family protein [unclassified Beijerinckia]MDH7799140.1 N-methylhydantoinase A [Beijerinckia sp. GAS462]SED93824.1 N-methylhydantoinase A [Beijerinckia sp. 28-YEA-48]